MPIRHTHQPYASNNPMSFVEIDDTTGLETIISISRDPYLHLSSNPLPNGCTVKLLTSVPPRVWYAYVQDERGHGIMTSNGRHTISTYVEVVQIACTSTMCVILSIDGVVRLALREWFNQEGKELRVVDVQDIISIHNAGVDVMLLQRDRAILYLDEQGVVKRPLRQPLKEKLRDGDYPEYRFADGSDGTCYAIWWGRIIMIVNSHKSPALTMRCCPEYMKSCVYRNGVLIVLSVNGNVLYYDPKSGGMETLVTDVLHLILHANDVYGVLSDGTITVLLPVRVRFSHKTARLGNCYQSQRVSRVKSAKR